MNTCDSLKNTGLCEGLSPDHIDTLASIIEEMDFPPNAIVIPEDNRSRDMYVIASGKVSVVANVPFDEGQIEVAESLRIGQVFGDVAFVDGFPRSATVKTLVDTKVFLIPFDKLTEIMDKDNQFGYLVMTNISRLLAQKIRNTTLALRNMML